MGQMTWDEKMEKAKQDAISKAEKDGLDEAATQALVNEAVAKVQKAKEEAEAKAAEKAKAKNTTRKYVVKVIDNPSFCGIGAGGVQFANGEAHISSDRMAAWFKEHNGYEVTET